MKAVKSLFFDLLLLAALVAFVGRAQTIPGGYRDGRPNAAEGTYSTLMNQGARAFQDQALDLENQAYGLAKLANRDPIKQSEQIYLLENQIIRLNLNIANASAKLMTPFERQALLGLTAHAYAITRTNGERIFEDMIRYIDIQIPGPSGRQNRTDLTDYESVYEANYRVDTQLTQTERDARYTKHLNDFVTKGGSLSEIKTLSSKVLNSYAAYTRVEYVWLLDGRIQVTEGKAGHVLLAAGQPVKAAGQMIFLKDPTGKFSMVVISNSSGNYKPDMLSVRQMAEVIERKLKVPSELVVLTKGEPMSTQAVKVYLKGRGADPQMIKNQVDRIEKKALAIRSEVVAPRAPKSFTDNGCAVVFGN